jgi:hypothetical protein
LSFVDSFCAGGAVDCVVFVLALCAVYEHELSAAGFAFGEFVTVSACWLTCGTFFEHWYVSGFLIIGDGFRVASDMFWHEVFGADLEVHLYGFKGVFVFEVFECIVPCGDCFACEFAMVVCASDYQEL